VPDYSTSDAEDALGVEALRIVPEIRGLRKLKKLTIPNTPSARMILGYPIEWRHNVVPVTA